MDATLLHDAACLPASLPAIQPPPGCVIYLAYRSGRWKRCIALPKIVLHSVVCFWLDKQFLPRPQLGPSPAPTLSLFGLQTILILLDKY